MILAVFLTGKKYRKNSEWVERSEQEALNEKWKRKLILFRKKTTNGAKNCQKPIQSLKIIWRKNLIAGHF
jgi:hypothetical protein